MSKSLAASYIEEVFNNLNYHATWFPNNTWRLGDVGLIEDDGMFVSQGINILDYGINYNIEEGELRSDDQMSFSSVGTNETKIGTKASVKKIGTAKIEINFSNEFGVFFKTAQYKVSKIIDQPAIGEAIIEEYKKNPSRWKSLGVIMELVQVTSGTILISHEKDASITLGGNVQDVTKLNLADAKLGITTLKKRGAISEFVAVEKFTPLFRIGRPVRVSMLDGVVIKSRSDKDTPPPGAVEDIDFDPDVTLAELKNG